MAEAIAFDLAKGVIQKLATGAVQQIGLLLNLEDELEGLRSNVSAIESLLFDAEEKSVTSNLVKDLLEKLKDVLYDADDLLDDFSIENKRQDLMSGNNLTKKVRTFFSSSNQITYGLKMDGKIKAIKARLDSIGDEMKLLGVEARVRPVEAPFMAERREQGHSFVRKEQIIGRDDDKEALLKLLLESEEKFLIIPVVGIGGLGKTALAQLVYNDDTVQHHFELPIWVCVSDIFNVKVIVENTIKSITKEAPKNLEMDQLQKQLRDQIDGKRYLLVLDDIWNEDRGEWDSLMELLTGGARGSRIIVTTRSQRVAKVTSSCPPHVLKGLSDDDAWILFKERAFKQRPAADSKNPVLVEIGKKVLEKCCGVPLVIRTIAGTLSSKVTENEWRCFKDNELAKVTQQEGKILPTLRLSYDHLPSPLKHCFAYSSLYPKDYEIDVQTLIQLWIAQGFVQKLNPNQSLEDIGFGYFKDLVDRSFFQEVEGEGFWMRCKMHDLMHELAESVAGTSWSTIIDSKSITNVISKNHRHVSIDFSLVPFREISIALVRAENLRTLLSLKSWSNVSDELWDLIISRFRCLRALHLENSEIHKVPPSIHKLKHLRYLDLSTNDLSALPESICKLQNLQVLKLIYCTNLEKLPKNIEKLVNLTHLALDYCWSLTHMPCGIGKLTSLERLSQFVVDKNGSHGGDLSELSGLSKLRGKLEITNLGYVKDAKRKFVAANLKDKAHLHSLSLEWNKHDDESLEDHDKEKSLEDLQPHPNLMEVYLSGWRGDASFPTWFSSLSNLVNIGIYGPSKFKHLPTFHKLRHLKVLQISDLSELEYMDRNLPAVGESESFFPSLKHLSLRSCPNLKSWWRNDGTTTNTIAFPCISYLLIQDCPLISMPQYPSLQEDLRLINCSSSPLLQTIQTHSFPLSKLKSLDLWRNEELDSHLLNECLQHLTSLESSIIRNIPRLVSLPFSLHLKEIQIEDCDGLTSLFPVFPHLTSLQSLVIRGCENLELSAPHSDTQIFQDSMSLRHLELTNIPKCRHLPEWLQHLTNLQFIQLNYFPNLTSLPDEIRCLTNLQVLGIYNAPQLSVAADWPNIAHIPDICI